MQEQEGYDILNHILNACRTRGVDAASASLATETNVGVKVREGKLEEVDRAESSAVSLRCFFGQRQANVSGSDLSRVNLDSLAERCVAMAKVVPEDQYCGLTPTEELESNPPELDLKGDGPFEVSELQSIAHEVENSALNVKEVKTISDCGAGYGNRKAWVSGTNGFKFHRDSDWSSVGIAVVAERNGSMERDGESWLTRKLSARPTPVEIGKTAANRAVARLESQKLDSRTANVIYDKRVSASLLAIFSGAIRGAAIARGVSFLKDSLGKQVFAENIDIIDDPFRPQGLGSRSFDGEGRPVSVKKLIENGILTTWMLNGPSAKQLKLKPNGFGSAGFGKPPGISSSNLYIPNGENTKSELMSRSKDGLLITDMFSPSINSNNGDYSVGVSGFWYENGETIFPVSEVTVAGNLKDMFLRAIPANDLEIRSSIDAPSILIEDMTLAGS